jgi:hypothetical protein
VLGHALAATAMVTVACTGRGLVVRDAGSPDVARTFAINTNPESVDLFFVIDNTNRVSRSRCSCTIWIAS